MGEIGRRKQNKAVLLIVLSSLCLFGCQLSSKKNTSSDAIVSYEYLSVEKEYSGEVNNWLSKAMGSDGSLYALSIEDGVEYIFGKGYTKAKVSYAYENIDGKISDSVKATLLKGERSDELFIKITYNPGIDVVTLDATDDQSKFFK